MEVTGEKGDAQQVVLLFQFLLMCAASQRTYLCERTETIYIFDFFKNRTVKLILEIMHIALKQFQFSLTVALGMPT